VRAILLAVSGAVVSGGRAQGQRSPPPVGLGRAVAQTGAALLAMPLGFVGGGLASRWAATRIGASDDRASDVGLVGAYAGGALATAAGPTLVGGGPHARGTYLAALGGTVVGGAGSLLLVHLNRAGDAGAVLRVVSAVGVVMLPSIGATVGYNLSRRYRP
jgi:hypothetical protein